MEDIRIMFFGTPEFAVSILQELIDEKYHVVAAVSQPDKPTGRKHIIVPTPVHALADKYNIPVLQPEKLSDVAEEVLSYEPDLIVTCAYGQFVNSKILEYPKYGCLNIHPSLLPKYRGGAPIQRAIMNGDHKTGVCLMEMTKAMDAGRVYACKETDIDPDETMSELSLRLNAISVNIIKEYLPKYLNGKLEGIQQDDTKKVIAPNIAREEEQVFFQKEELDHLYDHIRGLLDWPVAYGMIEGHRIKFYQVRKENTEVKEEPGTILGFKEHALEIACIGGILKVYALQTEGKKKMDADAYHNGNGKEMIGKRFE